MPVAAIGASHGAAMGAAEKRRGGPTWGLDGGALLLQGRRVLAGPGAGGGGRAATSATRRLDAGPTHRKPMIYIERRQVVGCVGCCRTHFVLEWRWQGSRSGARWVRSQKKLSKLLDALDDSTPAHDFEGSFRARVRRQGVGWRRARRVRQVFLKVFLAQPLAIDMGRASAPPSLPPRSLYCQIHPIEHSCEGNHHDQPGR